MTSRTPPPSTKHQYCLQISGTKNASTYSRNTPWGWRGTVRGTRTAVLDIQPLSKRLQPSYAASFDLEFRSRQLSPRPLPQPGNVSFWFQSAHSILRTTFYSPFNQQIFTAHRLYARPALNTNHIILPCSNYNSSSPTAIFKQCSIFMFYILSSCIRFPFNKVIHSFKSLKTPTFRIKPNNLPI